MVLVLLGVGVAGALRIVLRKTEVRPDDVLAAYRPDNEYPPVEIAYPFDEAVFPPEIPAPTFRWQDARGAPTRTSPRPRALPLG